MNNKLTGILILMFTLFAVGMKPAPERIVFFGDSITQAGVNPGGYIDVLGNMLKAGNKADQYELIGAGIGGNKVYDLYLRMEEDVVNRNPNTVVIWVGVNDVWHKRLFGTGTDADKFIKFYEAIIARLKEKKIAIWLCTPATIGEKNDYSNELDGDLNQYSKLIRDLARRTGCGLIDLRRLFHEYELKNNPDNEYKGILTVDGVHLNEKGNQLVAQAMKDHLKM